jgi:lactoylglutathione lyase
VAEPKFIYTGIHVSNLERAVQFYTKELGMKLLFESSTIKETGGKVAWLRSPGSKQILELNWYPKGYRHGGRSGLDHLAFQFDDVENAYSRLSKRSDGVLKPFVEGRWKLAFVKDPDGNWIELGEILKKRKRRESG